MFFLKTLEREISIHPSFLGANIHDFLGKKLYEDMEGSCNGEYYIICIMDINHISAGKVQPGTGVAEFTIYYRAILWKPFKGEAVDCVVTGVKAQGLFCEAGPLSVFVSKIHLPHGYKYNPDATPVQYSGVDGETIEKGTAVRVQLIGIRTDVTNLLAIGRMSAGWFGVI